MKTESNKSALMIDLGNSRLSWALYSGTAISAPASAPVAAGLPLEVTNEWQRIAPLPVYIANVAGTRSLQMLCRWFETHWNIRPVALHSQRQAHGVTNAYQQLESLGVDRWLGLVGARSINQLPVCVADCGSAVTIDVMDGNGMHQGGVIAPGYGMMLASLKQGTAIPDFTALSGIQGLLGKSTSECILSGCANTIAAIIDRVMRSGPRQQQLIMTGGDAAMISPLLEHPSTLIPDLVFRGMVQYLKE